MEFLIRMILTSFAAWSNNLCEGYAVPAEFSKMQKNVEKELRVFSNTKSIAAGADALLAKLIAAKSPMVDAWLKKRDLKKKSETEIATEWRLYFAKNFVLAKYPSESIETDKAIEKLVDGLLNQTFTPQFKAKLEKLFKRTKSEAIQTVEKVEINAKIEILERIKSIDLYWPTNLKSARNNTIPLDLIDWGIAYDPVPNAINVGLHALVYPNDETLLAVFAHEIGHAFDSCRWNAFFAGPWPFEKVGSCLRSAESVAAKRRDNSQLESLVASGKINKEMAQSLKNNPTCNKLIYPPAGIQADQLPEAFADWFSAEVMAQNQATSAGNVRRDLCENKDLREGSSYPKNMDRLNRIYLAHPKFNAQADKKSPQYCALSPKS